MPNRLKVPPLSGDAVESRPRLLFYSHDGVALGHRQRNLKVARRLVADHPGACALLITGARGGFGDELPPGVDYIKLPTVAGAAAGEFESVALTVGRRVIRELRANVIRETVAAFEPDLLVVDHLATGVWDELLPTLKACREAASRPRVVLGLRDILDEPAETLARWRAQGRFEAIDRYYDRVIVYGDEDVYPTAERYRFPDEVVRKLTYVGYVTPDPPLPDRARARRALAVGDAKLVVVTGGGGYDALPMMERCLAALPHVQATPIRMLLIAGPLMPGAARDRLTAAADAAGAEVWPQLGSVLPTLAAADVVVGMGGYNSVTEAITLGHRMLVMPRHGSSGLEALRLADAAATRGPGKPNRSEQALRAEAFAQRDLIELIPADAGPEGLAAAIERAARVPRRALPPFRGDGLETVSRLVGELLETAPDAAPGKRRFALRRQP